MGKSYIIGKNVTIGKKSSISDFVIIGNDCAELSTVIGTNASIRSHSVIYGGNVIGNNFQTGHGVLIREANSIGDDVSIGSHSIIEHHIKIGNAVRVHSSVFIPEFSVLEDHCWLGPHVTLTNAKYPKSKNIKENLKGPHIKNHAKIGANVTILPGVIIGEYALVGAGSVVTENVMPYSVVVGNPALVINSVKKLPYV